jgi:hypothetical protein
LQVGVAETVETLLAQERFEQTDIPLGGVIDPAIGAFVVLETASTQAQ